MAEYTYKDVIIDPEDPRIEIGAEYYFGDGPSSLLRSILSAQREARSLMKVCKETLPRDPFYNGSASYQCIIRKKKPEKKYVPFNLSKEEDRNFLRNKWVRKKDTDELWEDQILSFGSDEVLEEPYASLNMGSENAETLFKHFEFLDGTPCGRLVED